MDANTNLDLVVLHAAIVADIDAAFPALGTIEFYREDRESLTLPACLLDLTEFDEANDIDPGSEQQAVTARFEASFVIGFRDANARRSIRLLAASFSAWIRKRRFRNPANLAKKLPTGPAEFLRAYKDDFKPELDKYEVWTVEWAQVLHLGATVWTPGAAPPTIVYGGFSPDIGTGNEDDYTEVTQDE